MQANIDQLVNELAFFFRDNPFMDLHNRLLRLNAEDRESMDYEIAAVFAGDIFTHIKEHDSCLVEKAEIREDHLVLTCPAEQYSISLTGILYWNNFGPIQRSKTGRQTLAFFGKNCPVDLVEVERILIDYICDIEERLTKNAAKSDNAETGMMDILAKHKPSEYPVRLATFNSGWKGIKLWSPINELPLEDVFDASAYDKIGSMFSTHCYLTAAPYDVVYETMTKFHEIAGIRKLKIGFKHGEESLVEHPISVPEQARDILESQMVGSPEYICIYGLTDQGIEEARFFLGFNKRSPFQGYIELGLYASDFNMFARNIQRLGRFFERNHSTTG